MLIYQIRVLWCATWIESADISNSGVAVKTKMIARV